MAGREWCHSGCPEACQTQHRTRCPCAQRDTWQQGSWVPGEPLSWGSCLSVGTTAASVARDRGWNPRHKRHQSAIVKGRVAVAYPLPLICRAITWVGGAGRSHPVSLKVEPSPDSDQVAQGFDYLHISWVFLINKYSKVSHLCDLWIRKFWSWLAMEYILAIICKKL